MADQYFRAKADKGWSKASIYEFVKDAVECSDDEGEMFPIEKLTDADCQWFADKEFEIDGEHEEDMASDRDDLAVKLYTRIIKRK